MGAAAISDVDPKRAAVWWALSELYLDTEHPESWLEKLASIIAESGYAKDEIHRIFIDEVAPAFFLNGLSAIGEWEGWSEEYVTEQVSAHLHRGFMSRGVAVAFSKLTRPETIWNAFEPYLR